uniref:Uncharacterized protein n=1 Tax=Oryza glumipatula TaxID=40148 RepID=A0A0D9YPA7_9ORYZ
MVPERSRLLRSSATTWPQRHPWMPHVMPCHWQTWSDWLPPHEAIADDGSLAELGSRELVEQQLQGAAARARKRTRSPPLLGRRKRVNHQIAGLLPEVYRFPGQLCCQLVWVKIAERCGKAPHEKIVFHVKFIQVDEVWKLVTHVRWKNTSEIVILYV